VASGDVLEGLELGRALVQQVERENVAEAQHVGLRRRRRPGAYTRPLFDST